jgi:hypothetical protein
MYPSDIGIDTNNCTGKGTDMLYWKDILNSTEILSYNINIIRWLVKTRLYLKIIYSYTRTGLNNLTITEHVFTYPIKSVSESTAPCVRPTVHNAVLFLKVLPNCLVSIIFPLPFFPFSWKKITSCRYYRYFESFLRGNGSPSNQHLVKVSFDVLPLAIDVIRYLPLLNKNIFRFVKKKCKK